MVFALRTKLWQQRLVSGLLSACFAGGLAWSIQLPSFGFQQTQSGALPSNLIAQTESLTNDDVDDEQLQQLVRSLVAIQPLLEEANQALLAAEGEEQQREIEMEFMQNAASIVEAQGLTVDRYRLLMALANNDETFRARVAQTLDELGVEN